MRHLPTLLLGIFCLLTATTTLSSCGDTDEFYISLIVKYNRDAYAGEQQTDTLIYRSSFSWTATSPNERIHISEKTASATFDPQYLYGDFPIAFTLDRNDTGAMRSGTIQISTGDPAYNITYTLYQSAYVDPEGTDEDNTSDGSNTEGGDTTTDGGSDNGGTTTDGTTTNGSDTES